jgi:glycosyltransferase 2 family protein
MAEAYLIATLRDLEAATTSIEIYSVITDSTLRASIWDRKKIARWALGIGFSAVLLYLAVRGTDTTHIVHSLRKTDLTKVTVAVLFLFLSFWVRAWRWRYLLLSLKPVSVLPLFRSTMVGFMGNYLLPLRAGELMRAVSIGQTQNISKSSALGSIVLERVLDGITLSFIPFLLIAVLDLPRWIVQLNGLFFGIYMVALAVVMLSAVRGWTDFWLKRLFSLFPQRMASRLGWTADLFFQGMNGLNRARVLLSVSLLSLLCWLLHGLYYYLLFEAFDLNLSLWAALILQAVIGIGVTLPAAPGYVGNFEYATVLGLGLFGIDKEEAFAYSLLAHSFQFFPVVFGGLLFTFRGGLWRQVETEENKILSPSSHSPNAET